ncbi:DUF5709 domain-containing protein [Streptomyces sp. NPDC006446]|uniref:DUF5709 domain-containing protein n=1 Tax=Streptomyces sp. NPDC006446 TaxID=3154301 RepID=UPI0033B956D7
MGSRSEDDAMGDEVYQSEGPDVREDEGILDPEDTLEDRGSDPFDEGWSPPERPLAVDHRGTTPREQREGETLDEKLAEERTDPALEEPDDGEGALEDGEDDEPLDDEGAERTERPGALDEGAHLDAEHDMLAEELGIDGATSSSGEEVAVHLFPDEVPERLPDEDVRRPPEDVIRRLRSETDHAS